MDLKTLLAIFGTVFLAELGDKTQLATVLFAANRANSAWLVFAAASLALVVAACAIGVLAGSPALAARQHAPPVDRRRRGLHRDRRLDAVERVASLRDACAGFFAPHQRFSCAARSASVVLSQTNETQSRAAARRTTVTGTRPIPVRESPSQGGLLLTFVRDGSLSAIDFIARIFSVGAQLAGADPFPSVSARMSDPVDDDSLCWRTCPSAQPKPRSAACSSSTARWTR